MANTSGAKKMVRKIKKRYERNRALRSRVSTFIRKVNDSISSGSKDSAREAFRLAQIAMHKSVTKGVYNLTTISRKLSRMSARIKAMPVTPSDDAKTV